MTISGISLPGEQGAGDYPAVDRGWPRPAGPFVVAHRFGNDVSSLAEAEAIGVDVVEADVWLHRGRLEVRHSKTAGPLPILWDRWSLERGWTARLELATLLDQVPPKLRLMLDIKGRSPELAPAVMRLLRDRERDRPLLVCSQNWSQLERFRPHPDVSLVHSIGNRRQLSRAWQQLETDDHDAVSIHVRLLTAETVRALKERVSVVVTWPINDPTTAQRVLGWGVDGLTTDVPSRILPLDTTK